MSADNYLFVDQKSFKVYHRFASSIPGGLSERFRSEVLGEEVSEEEETYQAEGMEDAMRYCEEFGWTEYGVSIGTLCPVCRSEVFEVGGGRYPHCEHCGAVSELRRAISESGLSESEREIAERAVADLDRAAVLNAASEWRAARPRPPRSRQQRPRRPRGDRPRGRPQSECSTQDSVRLD